VFSRRERASIVPFTDGSTHSQKMQAINSSVAAAASSLGMTVRNVEPA